ncbi:MAG: outer membrane beta-barrel protein [Bacteroidota bacterium]
MRFLTTAVACLCIVFAKAQSGNISGKITDSSGKKNLPLTTITVFKAKDTSIITYRLSNDAGEFKIPSLPLNVPLRLMATYSGYEAFRKDFILTTLEPSVNFGTVQLTGTSKQLDEVIVFSERPPVVIKQDTIEFNASAFKTLPSALLEDLLKKLPGVYVDENGDISVNGQKVNRLLVDGKRFFGDDPKMATRNLPSNLIDKVQVMDDKEQIALNNDGDMSKIGKVLNITLKRGIKKAVFGRLFAGGGTDDRYEVGGIVNSFRDTLQLSLIGFANNINRSSFSTKDITQLGGFERSGWGNINGSGNNAGQQGFSVDGFSLGGTGAGISKASGAAINLNHSPNKIFNFFFQYMYGRTNNIAEQTENRQRYFGDTIVNTYTVTKPISNGTSHNAGAGGSWKPDTLTNINFTFRYAYAGNVAEAPSSIITNNNKTGPLNQGSGTLFTNGNTESYFHVITLAHRSRIKKGRNLSIFHAVRYTANPLSNITESSNHYEYPVVSNIIFQQLRATNAPSTYGYLNSNYSEPVNARLTLRLNSTYTYNKNVQDVLTYGKHMLSNQYDSLNISLSSGLAREQNNWSNNVVASYKINSVTVNIGTTWLQQWINNSFSMAGQSNKQYYSNLLLGVSANWKRFSIGFSQDVIAPGINYLIPVADNSNPFYIINGNPSIKPFKRNGISFNGNVFNTKTNTNYFFSAQSTVTDDAIIQSVILNNNGVQVNTPVNVQGAWSNYANLGFNRQFKNKQSFNLTVNLNATGNLSRTPIIFNNEKSYVTNANINVNTGLSFNWHDVVEFNPKYTPGITRSYYTNKLFSNRDITSQVLQGEFIVRLPKKIVWETNIMHRIISDVAPGIPKTSTYWNAAVTVLMFNQDKGQLRLAVYDILNANANVNRYFSANAIIDTRSNVLQRYFMLTYSYNIRSFGNQPSKVGGQQSLWRF